MVYKMMIWVALAAAVGEGPRLGSVRGLAT